MTAVTQQVITLPSDSPIVTIEQSATANKSIADITHLLDRHQPDILSEASFPTQETSYGGPSIKIHWRDLEISRRVELFKKFAKPVVIPGRKDLGEIKCFGGLGATGYPMLNLAHKVSRYIGMHTEVFSLAGHTGTFSDLKWTSEEEWIGAMQLAFREVLGLRIGCFYSTSLPVAFEVERRKPGTFDAIVGIGGPFFLKNEKLESYLNLAERLDRFSFNSFSSFLSVPFGQQFKEALTKLERKSPSITHLPVKTALSLLRVMRMARVAASEIHCPIFYAQGADDPVVSPKVFDFLRSTIPAEDKFFKIYPKSGHGPHIGPEKKEFFRDVSVFLQNVLDKKYAGTGKDIPKFTKAYQQELAEKKKVLAEIMGGMLQRGRTS